MDLLITSTDHIPRVINSIWSITNDDQDLKEISFICQDGIVTTYKPLLQSMVSSHLFVKTTYLLFGREILSPLLEIFVTIRFGALKGLLAMEPYS